MVTIKFERSRWEQHRVNLGAEHFDPVIAIPEEGTLPSYKFDATIFASETPMRENLPSSFARWEKEYAHLRPAVRVKHFPPDEWELNGLILLWIEERGEWVAITYREWVEGAGLADRSFSGPFALSDACARKILEAYEITEEKISLSEVRGLSPEKFLDRRP